MLSPMSKPSNSIAAAALALGVDAQDLSDIIHTLQYIKEERKKGNELTITISVDKKHQST